MRPIVASAYGLEIMSRLQYGEEEPERVWVSC